MADFQRPVNTDNYADVLPQLRTNTEAAIKMLYQADPLNNLPTGAVRFNQATGTLETWTGTAWQVVPMGVPGGGTGATTAPNARTNLDVYGKDEVYTTDETYSRSQVDARIADGTVQLTDSITTENSSIAASATAAKTLNDKIEASTGVNESFSKQPTGYVKLTSGILFQWGNAQASGTGFQTVAFPTVFTATPRIMLTPATDTSPNFYVSNRSISDFEFYWGTADAGANMNWLAVAW